MNVIYELSKKKGIGLTTTCLDQAYQKALVFPYETKTSFQHDYEKKQGRDERDLFGKTIIDMTMIYGIDANVVEEVYNIL